MILETHTTKERYDLLIDVFLNLKHHEHTVDVLKYRLSLCLTTEEEKDPYSYVDIEEFINAVCEYSLEDNQLDGSSTIKYKDIEVRFNQLSGHILPDLFLKILECRR